MTTTMDYLPKLPQSWLLVAIRDVAENVKYAIVDGPFGSQMKVYEFTDKGIPLIEMQNLKGEELNLSFRRFITEGKFIEIERSKVKTGDLIVSKTGTLGLVAIVPSGISKAMITSRLAKISFDKNIIYLKFAYYFMKLLHSVNYWEKVGKGSTMKVLTIKDIANTYIPIAPFPEQKRIVAKVEELFTRLDAGVEALKKIKAQIKRYRQTVLKYAFEGKLTAEWREKHKDELEPASVLLERIKAERKKTLGNKYKEPSLVDITDLPKLPEGWVWTRVGNVSKTIQYGTSEKANDDPNGIPVIRMGNILDGTIIFDKLKYFPKEWQPLEDFVLQNGDVLFNRTNSMELVGKTAVYKDCHPKAVFASYLIRVRLREDSYIPELLSFFINSFYGRRYITSVVSQQVGQANVNGTKLSFMPIPMPSFAEQQSIVQKIERRFSVADEIERVIDQTLKQADRLRQSILKRAFEGKLVPQDPSDEPAEKLLERIKAEKEQMGTMTKQIHKRNKLR